MGSFIGGSAPAMARQISNGFTLISAPMLKRLTLLILPAPSRASYFLFHLIMDLIFSNQACGGFQFYWTSLWR